MPAANGHRNQILSLRIPFWEWRQKSFVTKDDSGIDPFSASERDAIIEAFENHPIHKFSAPFVKFLFMTGCRTGEAIGFKWKHRNSDCSPSDFL